MSLSADHTMFPTTMETSTYDYDDYNATPYEICYGEKENRLGANLSVLFYFMFVFSLFGNGLVLIIIHRFEKLTTVTNILLLNLVVSALIFVSSLPFMGVYMHLSNWIFGNAMCKIVGTVYYLGLYSSVLFLALLTFDRHIAVVYSLEAPRMRSRRYAVFSCGVVWLVSILACVRQMIIYNVSYYNITNTTMCDEYAGDFESSHLNRLRDSGIYIQFFLFLIFPLTVIIYCYTRITITVIKSKIATKFKTVRLIFIIVLFFFVCWTPFNIVLLVYETGVTDTTCEERERWGYALHFTRNLAYAYFCISPIFYTFVGRKFQNYFRLMLVKRFPRLRKYVAVSQHSAANMSTKTTPNELAC